MTIPTRVIAIYEDYLNHVTLKMKELSEGTYTEGDHKEADDLLITFLFNIGLNDLATNYEKVSKWYA